MKAFALVVTFSLAAAALSLLCGPAAVANSQGVDSLCFRLTDAQQAWVEQTFSRMTLDERIGQVIFPMARGVFTNQESDAFEKIKKSIVDYDVGGYHLEGEGGDPATAVLLVRRM